MSRVPLGWKLRTLAAVAVIPPLVGMVPFEPMARRLGRKGRVATGESMDVRLARGVDRLLGTLPPPWRHTCLRRSAVLYYLLRRAGRDVTWCLGVRRSDSGAIAAHAWLERNGEHYLEPPDPGAAYEELYRT